jgi:nucleotide-binding universal stress UspA family protein
MAMQRILVPVDGSDTSRRAVSYVATMCRGLGSADIRLLNVQPAPIGWQTRHVAEETIKAHARQRGEETLAEARRILEAAGVTYSLHVEYGEPAETIARICNELSCESITMGTRGLGLVGKLVIGSVATKVLHLVEVPVTLVK